MQILLPPARARGLQPGFCFFDRPEGNENGFVIFLSI